MALRDPDSLAEYLAEMADRACVGNPNLPIPISEKGETEIDLSVLREDRDGPGRASWIAPEEELEFEDDEEVAFDAAALLDLEEEEGGTHH